jgi:lipoprotein-anchoring transpeptidase ErfK/SrfK
MTLPVMQMAQGGQWLRVRLPMRPDEGTGWVLASAGSESTTSWGIVVHRSARRALVLDDDKVQATFPIIVGKPSTPTPTGSFFVVEMLQIAPGVAEGPWALATSAYSNVLEQFDGGDGEVALHGTTGLVGELGTFASHGCIRFAPAAITWIANRIVPGTPVIITG